jgi:ribonucleotide reductase alpha subunit
MVTYLSIFIYKENLMTPEPVKVTDLKSMETALNSPDSIGDEVALKYWGKEGEKSFADIVNRMVNYVCSDWPSDDRADLRQLIMERKFMPNTPCWMNAGTELKSLAACFVLPLEDSMDSIFTTVKNMAMVLKEGGGVGISLSKLRPENSPVKKTKGVSSGPISFLKVFDAVVDTVKQGGARRGAAMANLRVDHPDILKFIRCKEKEGSISNFNISVAITDSFVSALTNKTKFLLQHNGMVYESIDPNIILDAIAESSWKNGEPGIQFIDTVNRSGLRGYCAKFSEYNTGLEVSNPYV